MAHTAKAPVIVKLLTPEQVGQAVAEWMLVRMGMKVDARCRVKTEFYFNAGCTQFNQARVEVKVL